MLLKKDDICCPCVYLLKKDGVVVYVGSSEYGLSRCLSHKDRIDFNEIDFQPCELRQMHNLEAENIVKYKTQRNIILPANEVYMTLNKCVECGDNWNLNVHHETYEHIGKEEKHLDDLMLLCEKCHEQEHGIGDEI